MAPGKILSTMPTRFLKSSGKIRGIVGELDEEPRQGKRESSPKNASYDKTADRPPEGDVNSLLDGKHDHDAETRSGAY